MAAAAGEDMQAIAGVPQHLRIPVLEALLQLGAEDLAHVPRCRRLAGCVFVVLVDVVLGHLRQRGVGVVQTGRGHAPGADRRTQQMHRVAAAGQPVAEDEAVQAVQDQPLRAAGRRGHDAHVGGLQATLAQVLQGRRPGMDLQSLHAGTLYDGAMEHDHDHDHEHSELGEMELRVRALETVLAQKGYIDPGALDVLIDTYQTRIGPRNGARVVARAWSDPAFRRLAAADATAAIASLGYSGRQGEHMVVAGEHAAAAPHGGVHAVQLLPVAGAGPAAHLVQERALPLARGERPARRARRLRRRACPKAPRSASGIPPPSCATWCSRAAGGHRGIWTKSNWPSW